MKLVNYNSSFKVLKAAQNAGIETIPQLMALLYIAQSRESGRTVSGVRDHLGMSQSAASRACRFLSSRFNAKRIGLNLVDSYADVEDVRSKFFRLNANGRAFIDKL